MNLTNTLPLRSPLLYIKPANMSRRPKPRKLKQYHRQQPQSSFLNLPPEIRNLIYDYALVNPTPIDLWPHLFHTDLSNDSAWQSRMLSWNGPAALDELPFKTRNQASLLHVREQMAVGLLETCRQVYNEAALYFWADNHFRFSGHSGWQGLLRFFLTIGPAARARIRRMDVHAPVYMRWPEKDGDERDLNGRSKNWPKMRMAKIPPEGHLDRVAVQRVCAILAQDRTMEEMNFVVPKGLRNGDEIDYGGYVDDHDAGAQAYDRLRKISSLDFIKKTVIVEEGGYLAVIKGPEQIMDESWDLVCLPGSAIYEMNASNDYEKQEVTETRTWISPARQWDYLLGINVLFQTPEPLDRHANGGKHTKSLPPLERVLKGFGGCNFVVQHDGAIRPSRTWAPLWQEWDYLLGVSRLFLEDRKAVSALKQVGRKKRGRKSRVGKEEGGERGGRGARRERGGGEVDVSGVDAGRQD